MSFLNPEFVLGVSDIALQQKTETTASSQCQKRMRDHECLYQIIK